MPRPSCHTCPRALQVTEPQRFLALGDSYTIGEGVAAGERWPNLLAQALRAEGILLADPELVAVTGWTTDELAAGIRAAAPRGPYGLVSLGIGVNNQYRGRLLQEYEEQFVELLEDAVGFAGGQPARVMVLSIPDWGVTPFAAGRDRQAIEREIAAFNARARDAARARGAHFVDVTPASRAAGHDPRLLAPDGLHPSGEMYREWVALALPVARRALVGRPPEPGG